MLAKIHSAGIHGMDGYPVSVEVDACKGLPRSVVVGNVSASIREALERCSVALRNAGIPLPPGRLTINLQPADLKKDGSCFDLPILTGMLCALGLVGDCPLDDYGFLGEVGLDGRIRHVRGILSLVSALQDNGFQGAIVPEEDVQEALVVEGMDILGVGQIEDLLRLLASEEHFRQYPRIPPVAEQVREEYVVDFQEVRGQAFSVRAALIAAAGGHNLLLSGVAGSGKTMIAKRIPSIMPALSREENIAITKLYSIAGLLPKGQALYNRRPFRAPHHSITTAALIGGCAQGGVMPGELALASKGVLFLDELPLFSKASIEALRQPIEDRKVVINRMQGVFTYPADCLIVAAMNPCPCGYYPDRTRCHCTPGQIRSYQRGISKPILERIDLCVEVRPVDFSAALSEDALSENPHPENSRSENPHSENSHSESPRFEDLHFESGNTTRALSSAALRREVIKARERQKARAQCKDGQPVRLNGHMDLREIRRYCALGKEEQAFMGKVYKQKGLSMRTYHKILKVARTIADLAGEESIRIPHLSEAVGYRSLEDRIS